MRVLGPFAALAFSQFIASCQSVAFNDDKRGHGSSSSLFGVTRGGGASAVHEPEKAANTILDSIVKVEQRVQKAVTDEVHALFHHHDEEEKEEIVKKAQSLVEKGADKIKKQVDEHQHPKKYPFESTKSDAPSVDHKDHRILHAVESAELAVLHAVEDEVETLFHELHHEDDKEKVESAKKVVAKGVKKAKAQVEEVHKHRRDWLTGEYVDIQDYMDHDLD